MRIDAYNKISQIYGVNGKNKTTPVSKKGSSDKVEISNFGKELQIAKQAVADSADVREDKIAELKNRINNGTYSVSAESFAEKMIAKYDGLMG